MSPSGDIVVSIVFLRRSVYVYNHRVARSQPVVLGGGDVHGRLESQVLVVKDVAPENLVFFLFLVV